MDQEIVAEGLFEIVTVKSKRAATATARLILVCRGGRLFGSDPKGRVYTGRLVSENAAAVCLSILKGTYEIPVKCPALRRPRPRGPGIRVPVTGAIDPLARTQRATVFVAARAVDIEITYLGPLPS